MCAARSASQQLRCDCCCLCDTVAVADRGADLAATRAFPCRAPVSILRLLCHACVCGIRRMLPRSESVTRRGRCGDRAVRRVPHGDSVRPRRQRPQRGSRTQDLPVQGSAGVRPTHRARADGRGRAGGRRGRRRGRATVPPTDDAVLARPADHRRAQPQLHPAARHRVHGLRRRAVAVAPRREGVAGAGATTRPRMR
jgi:hypothetical protein